MSVVLELEPDVEVALTKKADAKGLPLSKYLETVVRREMTLDEILAPVRKNFADSGMSEEELNEVIDRERQAMWEEKQALRG